MPRTRPGPAASRQRVRRVRRGLTFVLAAVLIALTAASALGTLRQTQIVDQVAAESRRTDQYQEAVALATEEMSLLQATVIEPDGEERHTLEQMANELVNALNGIAAIQDEHAAVNARLAARQLDLEPHIHEFLDLIDSGQSVAARKVLESDIEPSFAALLLDLRLALVQQLLEYNTRLDRAQSDSRLLRTGLLAVCALGLVVLALLGWAGRARRAHAERMASTDALTGLPNRPAFHRGAEQAFAEAGDGPERPTVLMLDLDGFKEVNDSLGHHFGDLLLVEVGYRLRGCVRAGDLVARLGGDEFAVLLTDTSRSAGENAALRIADEINRPFVIEGVTLDIEVSVGIFTAGPGTDVATAVRNADTAMYAAKTRRLGHARFDPAQEHDAATRLALLGDLRRALDSDDEIELYYQPKVAIGTGDLIGAEALARWQHPTRGFVTPDKFIPVLEGTSLIHRFTARVLTIALAQSRAWLDAGDRVPVAVNVSTRCLLDLTFPDTVATELRRAGLPGDHLCIEITENTVMADPDRAVEVLRRIRQLNVRTSIDDFGTGYSSMAYLNTLPVDEIKVDRSFVRDMASDHSNYVLVEAAVDLGHNLGLAVVAEGVEDDSTVAALQGLGCDVAQGYHYAKPLPAPEFTAYLATLHQAPARLGRD